MEDEYQKNRRILIVDDTEGIHGDFRAILGGTDDSAASFDKAESAVFGTTSDLLQEINFEIDSAFQGKEALEKVQQALREGRPYAVAFVDVRMPPGWDGIETIQRIWKEYPELQVVICTAYSDYQWSEITKKLGNTERLLILRKPFDKVEVYQLANALTEKWNLARKASIKMEELKQMIGEKTNELTKTNEQLTKEIAERKEAQEKLEKNGSDLESLIKERTEQLAAEKELLLVTLSSIGEGVITVDAVKQVTLFNKVAEELTGWKFEEVRGKRIDEVIRFIDEQSEETIESPIDRVLKSVETESGTSQDCLVVKGGSIVPVASSASPIRRDDKSVVGIVMVFRDVSRYREIDRMKTDFVSSVSHELRTPLTSIKAYTATIMRDPTMPEDTRREFLSIIDEESNRLANLIEDLLEVSRIEAGTVKVSLHSIDIAGITDQALLALEALAGKKNIQLKRDIAVELPELKADETKIQSVITNLVNNAIKFTPEGGQVLVCAQHQGQELIIRISDTGIGIPKKALKKIFDRFYRVHRPGEQTQGTGLGLAIVKEIISLHGGRIEVESEVGQGTTFTVFLPLSVQQAVFV